MTKIQKKIIKKKIINLGECLFVGEFSINFS